MTDAVFNKMFCELVNVEGGYQCQPQDKGNWTGGKIGVGELKGTKFGVSASAYPNLDIKNLTIDDARRIFQKDYWDRCQCDLLADSWAILVSDFAYNSGVNIAKKTLQQVVGAKVDGIIGNQTLCMARKCNKELIDKYSELRLIYCKKSKGWATYGNGWTNRINKISEMAKEYL